VFAIVKLITV